MSTDQSTFKAVKCRCGVPVAVLKSWTSENPGRRFCKCKFRKPNSNLGCGYFKWIDEEQCEWQRNTINQLNLEKKVTECEMMMLKCENAHLQEQNRMLKEANHIVRDLKALENDDGVVEQCSRVTKSTIILLVFIVVVVAILVKLKMFTSNFEKALHWENRTRKFVVDFQTLFARLQSLIPTEQLYDLLELEGELGQLPVIMKDFWWRGYAMEAVVPTVTVSAETVRLKMGEYLRLRTTIINFLELIVTHITYEHLSDVCHGRRICNIDDEKLDFIDMYDQVMKNRAEGIEPKWDAHDIYSNPAL